MGKKKKNLLVMVLALTLFSAMLLFGCTAGGDGKQTAGGGEGAAAGRETDAGEDEAESGKDEAGSGKNEAEFGEDEAGSGKNEADSAKSTDAKKGSRKITLNEVAHSVFYAPMYVAIENGYFEEEGISLDLVTGYGADKTMTAVLAGEAEIGFMGPETTVYTYNEGADDLVVNFAQLTQRAGNFVVAREPAPDFTWEQLKGSYVYGGRAGGMPQMVLEYVLKKNKIDPANDLTIDQSIDFGSTAAAFSSGEEADYTVEFEPGATLLEQQDAGYVVASLGVESGYVPYTAFSARASFLDENPDLIQSFTNALQKGMDYVNGHTPEETAAVIAPQFPETDEETVSTIVARYAGQDTWNTDLVFREESYRLLLDILEEAGELEQAPEYGELVNTGFAEAAQAAD